MVNGTAMVPIVSSYLASKGDQKSLFQRKKEILLASITSIIQCPKDVSRDAGTRA